MKRFYPTLIKSLFKHEKSSDDSGNQKSIESNSIEITMTKSTQNSPTNSTQSRSENSTQSNATNSAQSSSKNSSVSNSKNSSQGKSNSSKDSSSKPDEKQILNDLMGAQLKMSSQYNQCATTCTSTGLRTDLLNILKDNYDVYSKEYDEAKRRGWVNEVKATTENMDTVKAKYDNSAQG